MQYTYSYNGTEYKIDLSKQADGTYLASIGDETFIVDMTTLANGGMMLQVDGERVIVHTASNGDKRYIAHEGTHYELEVSTARSRRRKSFADNSDLTAQMPGQVTNISVEEGQTVANGDVLLIMEAMKMEIRITAPYDGVVRAIHIDEGQIVDRGQKLVDINVE